ncbi:MAG: 1-deoxy-D-xylulose-5-phosphate synthase [Paludibacteraceae bacterium]|nr:1-deoxy-D-xylulose-5-phosphate synthase [Paludibacteraceae bacterium]
MEYKYLNQIEYPRDLKQLPINALSAVCDELRDFIIQELSHNPGHLASSLGTIELTVALHYVFDTPHDKLIWDVGHQAYAHKILTGRRARFSTNRQFKGLAPFPTPQESEYDAFISGHASNSISAALGMEIADELQQVHRNVVAIIGDGAMTGGLAFEGLNNTSMDRNNLLIILNDNNMAIDPIKGGFTQYLVDITTSERYNKWRWELYRLMNRLHIIDEKKTTNLRRFSNNLKTILTKQPSNIFQSMNIRYFGPADGHSVTDLVRILSEIKNHQGPKVLHIITKKGKGYKPAEQNQTIWHAPGKFDPETGVRNETGQTPVPLWQDVFGDQLLALAQKDKRIVGVTPAMPTGCSMCTMQQVLPERVFDVGIAEGHAVTFSAGLAKDGILPYCNIYSTFMQRAYDNIVHDVALQNLHVVFCIDRAGIVGNDGATHHGLFDMAYLRPIPNMQIAAPMTKEDLEEMMEMAVHLDGPIAIRYPRGKSVQRSKSASAPIPAVEYGKGVLLREGQDIAVLSIGAIGNAVNEAIDQLAARGMSIAHWNMRWLKPMDTSILDFAGTHFSQVVTVEDGILNGGMGSAVLEYFADKGYTCHVKRLGIDDQFVEHGSPEQLYHLLGLDAEGIIGALEQLKS